MIKTIVVAISENNAIGKNNQLLWYLPADLKHFKNITTGHTVIMGRKTYDSVGKPLPNRRNIIITRQNIAIEGCEVVNSIAAALDLCKTDRIYLTVIHKQFEGDSFFPEIKKTDWLQVSREEHQPDEKNSLPYSFIT